MTKWIVDDRPNPDYNMNLYKWQDANTEIPPKWMENRDLGYALEAAGDIFRELTGRSRPDYHYIGEKTERLERRFRNEVDVEEMQKPLSEKDRQRTNKLKELWSSLSGLSVRLKAVRDLNIALADQNILGAESNLRRFIGELGREMQSYIQPTRRPQVLVYQHVRRR